MGGIKTMKEVYKDMEGVYQKIEKELLEMGAIKVAENTDKPSIIITGKAYQPDIDLPEFASDQEDPLYWFISKNLHFGDDTLIIEALQNSYMSPLIERVFLSKRESLQDLILKNSVVTGISYETEVNLYPSLTFVIVDNSKGTLEEIIEYVKERNYLFRFRAYSIPES